MINSKFIVLGLFFAILNVAHADYSYQIGDCFLDEVVSKYSKNCGENCNLKNASGYGTVLFLDKKSNSKEYGPSALISEKQRENFASKNEVTKYLESKMGQALCKLSSSTVGNKTTQCLGKIVKSTNEKLDNGNYIFTPFMFKCVLSVTCKSANISQRQYEESELEGVEQSLCN